MKVEIDEYKVNVVELMKDMLVKEIRWVLVEKGVVEVFEGEVVNDDVL